MVKQKSINPDFPEERLQFIWTPINFISSNELTTKEAFLLGMIKSLEYNSKGYCYASNKYLSEKVGISERYIKKLIKNLEEKEFILVDRKWHGKNNLRRKIVATQKTNNLIVAPPLIVKRGGELKDTPGVYSRTPHSWDNKDDNKEVFTKVNTGDLKNRPIKLSLRRTKKKDDKEIKLSSDINHVINHWISLEFSKPKITSKLVKKINLLLKKQNRFQICKVFDEAKIYLDDNDWNFVFAPTSLITFINSITPLDHPKYKNKYQINKKAFKKSLPKNISLTWFNIFKLKDQKWLETNLLNEFNENKKDEYYDIIIKNVRTGTLSRSKERSIIKGAQKMKKWCEANKIKSVAMSVDFPTFLNEKFASTIDFKYYWLSSDKFWNETYSPWIVNYGRFNHINEVEEI